ncbi:MAG TPA: hypothetical protein VGP68_02675 [Gemmataceae bacterium]|jgi:hypothetical protein|nr:hypothetical protein [Gemmataceae bacterium]
MDIEDAPIEVSRSGKPYVSVLLCGVITSALTLGGVYWLSRTADDFHILGWYVNYVIPAGAMIVGAAASSGYALASWLTGTRISRGLLIAVLFLQTVAYVTAEYVEYSDVMDSLRQQGVLVGQEPSFLEYYDFKARSFAWKPKGNGNQQPEALGGWGYVFVLLGAAGFVLSGLAAPALLYKVPYCEACQRYMKRKVLGVLPASVPVKKIGKKDQPARDAHAKEQEQAAAKADEALVRLRAAVDEERIDTVKQELLAAGAIKANEKLSKRVRVSLAWCKGCRDGLMILTHVSGQGKELQAVELGRHTVPATLVCELLDKPVA